MLYVSDLGPISSAPTCFENGSGEVLFQFDLLMLSTLLLMHEKREGEKSSEVPIERFPTPNRYL